jgi:hypothetical protein
VKLIIPTYRRVHCQKTLAHIPVACHKDVLLAIHADEWEAHKRHNPTVGLYVLPNHIKGYRQVMQHLWEAFNYTRWSYCDDDINGFLYRTYDPQAKQKVKAAPLDEAGWMQMLGDLHTALDDPEMGIVQPAPAWRIPALNSWPIRRNTQTVQFMAVDGPRLKHLDINWMHTPRCPDASVCLQVLSSGFKTAQLQQYKMQVSPMFAPGGNKSNEDHQGDDIQLEIDSHAEMMRLYPRWVRPHPSKPGYAKYYWSQAYNDFMKEAEEDHLCAMDRLMGEEHWRARGSP